MGSDRHGGGSSTIVMEHVTPASNTSDALASTSKSSSVNDRPFITTQGHKLGPDSSDDGSLPSPTTATAQQARWNHPRSNIYRVCATFYSFMILGANDAAYGALIPYLERYYNVNYTVISLVFLSPIIGYGTSALTNNMIHMKFGQRGIAIMMSISHVVAYAIISIHPPYPVLVIIFILAGFGNGLGDSAWNAWIGDMANANEILGFLHGFYGLGAALSPLIATSLITKAGWEWYEFYYIMVGAAVIEFAVLTTGFWRSTGPVFRAEHPHTAEDVHSSGIVTPVEGSRPNASVKAMDTPAPQQVAWYVRLNPLRNSKSRTAAAVKNKVTMVSAVFLLVYVGVEVSIGGWIVTFMLRVRNASDFASGLSATGFWLGMTVGRFVLGFVTARLFKTEKHAIAAYLLVCVGLQLLFWLVPRFIVSAVMVGFLGFFLGPLFPAAIVAMTKLLPKKLHVAAIGFAAAFGASGACVLPFAIGAIANAKGVQVLQPIILAMLVLDLGLWMLLPKLPKQRTA